MGLGNGLFVLTCIFSCYWYIQPSEWITNRRLTKFFLYSFFVPTIFFNAVSAILIVKHVSYAISEQLGWSLNLVNFAFMVTVLFLLLPAVTRYRKLRILRVLVF